MKHVPNEKLEYDAGLMLLDGEPFTGIGDLFDAQQRRVGEIEYREGLEWGMKRGWESGGKLDYEAGFYKGVMHGKHREWHGGSVLAEEGDYELGHLLRKKVWDQDGKLLEDYELKETDPAYQTLLEYRKIYGADLAREESSKET